MLAPKLTSSNVNFQSNMHHAYRANHKMAGAYILRKVLRNYCLAHVKGENTKMVSCLSLILEYEVLCVLFEKPFLNLSHYIFLPCALSVRILKMYLSSQRVWKHRLGSRRLSELVLNFSRGICNP